MKHYWVLEWLCVLLFQTVLGFTTDLNIFNWKWWVLMIAIIPSMMFYERRGYRKGKTETVDIIVKIAKDKFGDSAEVHT